MQIIQHAEQLKNAFNNCETYAKTTTTLIVEKCTCQPRERGRERERLSSSKAKRGRARQEERESERTLI